MNVATCWGHACKSTLPSAHLVDLVDLHVEQLRVDLPHIHPRCLQARHKRTHHRCLPVVDGHEEDFLVKLVVLKVRY